MSEHPMHQAYVQAWVWIELPIRQEPPYTDAEIIAFAQEVYQEDGAIEFDDDAIVSRGDEVCDCDVDDEEEDEDVHP
jgi:hypothetical protein